MKVLLVFMFIIIFLFLILITEKFESDEWDGDVVYNQDKIIVNNAISEGDVFVDKLSISNNSLDNSKDDLSFLENLPTKTDEYMAIGGVKAYEKDFNALKYFWPVGTIVAYAGFLEDIEKMNGWALCDGKNGTPNLVDRFIRGTDDSDKIGLVGGEKEHIIKPNELSKHRHVYDLLVSLPSHPSKDISLSSDEQDKQIIQKIQDTYNNYSTNTTKVTIAPYPQSNKNLGEFLRPSSQESDFDDANPDYLKTCSYYQTPIPKKALYFTPCLKYTSKDWRGKHKHNTKELKAFEKKCHTSRGYTLVGETNPRKAQQRRILSGGLGNTKEVVGKCVGSKKRGLCQNNNKVIAGFETNNPDIILQDHVDNTYKPEPRNQLPQYYALFYIIRIDENLKKQNFAKERPAPTEAPPTTTSPKLYGDNRYSKDDEEKQQEQEEEEDDETNTTPSPTTTSSLTTTGAPI